MIIIPTSPRTPYYFWMLEALINQNRLIGMDMSKFHIVLAFSPDKNDMTNNPDVVEMYQRLERANPDVGFFYYQDTRNPITYLPSIVPMLLKQHLYHNRWLEKEALFLTDPDQLWITKPDYSDLERGEISYTSDSRGFVNHSYLTYGPRPKHIIEDLENLVGLRPGTILEQNGNSGGSHYLVKSVPWGYFEKVEQDSDKIYKYLLDYNAKYDKEWGPEKINGWVAGVSGIQAWAASMWALLYNLWYYGKETRITKRLDFCWGSDTIERWNTREIFHNAGVVSATAQSHNLFYKAEYTTRLPYKDIFEKTYNEGYATSKYVEILRRTAKESCLVGWEKLHTFV